MEGPTTDDVATAALNRRRFLRRAALAGGAAWAVPTLVTLPAAGAAEAASQPPSGTPPVVGGTEVTPPEAGDPGTGPGTGVEGVTTLPRTGADIDVLAATGTAAIAAGVALRVWTSGKLKAAERADAGSSPFEEALGWGRGVTAGDA